MSIPRIAVCPCGARNAAGGAVAMLKRINPRGDWHQVFCPECYRSGPKKDGAAAAVNWWNEETAAIKNPRDDLVPYLDKYCDFYGPMQGAGEK